MKTNLNKILLLLIFSFIAVVGIFSHITGACTVIDTNSLSATFGQRIFGNCTIDSSSSNGINVFSNTLAWNIPNAFFLYYIAIYASIAFFLLVQDRSFARYIAITLFGFVLAIVMQTYGILGTNAVIMSGSLFGLAVVASFFFHSNR